MIFFISNPYSWSHSGSHQFSGRLRRTQVSAVHVARLRSEHVGPWPFGTLERAVLSFTVRDRSMLSIQHKRGCSKTNGRRWK